MAGLFDTLSLGSRSLNTYRKAIDTTGHNLANVNTPGYARQRVAIESVTNSSDLGPLGAGAEAARIVRYHSEFFDKQIQVETSIEGSLDSRHGALKQTLSALQETIDRNGASGTTTSGISQGLAEFFAAMQSLSTNPASVPERQVALGKAQALATKFNQADARLADIEAGLNRTIAVQVDQVNSLGSEIARLNQAIMREEAAGGSANDLRDSRQLKIEELARLARVEAVEQPDGGVNVVLSGVTLVEGNTAVTSLETFDDGSGNLQVRAAGGTTALALTGGALEGTISARDNDVRAVRAQINELASSFIQEANAIHSAGYSLSGTTGENLFDGSNAADIRVNTSLLGNPALFQASGREGEAGNNSTVLALAQLGSSAQAALGGLSFSDRQTEIVTSLGQKVANAEIELADQKAISNLAKNQREALSGVSLDEEMSNLLMFQKAFQASARLISMTDEMLQTIIQM